MGYRTLLADIIESACTRSAGKSEEEKEKLILQAFEVCRGVAIENHDTVVAALIDKMGVAGLKTHSLPGYAQILIDELLEFEWISDEMDALRREIAAGDSVALSGVVENNSGKWYWTITPLDGAPAAGGPYDSEVDARMAMNHSICSMRTALEV